MAADSLEARAHTPRGVVLPLLGTAAVYTLLGVLCLQLAIPIGYASPMYPSAGVALACVWVYGRPAAAGALLGACATNLLVRWLNGDSISASTVLISLVIGVGAMLQALAGAALTRRYVRQPFTLDALADIARFFALAGALACTISATIAITSLAAGGVIARSQIVSIWLTWWGGDSLGVLIAAPVALAFIGRPRVVWENRRLSVAAPLVLAMLLLALAIYQVSRWNRDRAEATFARDAQNLNSTVSLRLQMHLDALDALDSVYVGSDDVNRTEFSAVASLWLSKLPSLHAVGWHERVARTDVAKFEAAVRAEGLSGYRVFSRDAGLVAGDDEVIAMRYIEPHSENSSALGVNVLSIPAARDTVERARITGESEATPGFRLTQEQGHQVGVVVYRAVFAPGDRTGTAGRPLRGLLFITLRMDDALRALSQGAPSYLRACLFDIQERDAVRLLAGPASCGIDEAAPMAYSAPLRFAGRAWALRVTAPHGLPGAGENATAWLFSVIGLVATGFLGALLLTATGRTRRIEDAVRERTAQLEHEMSERRLTEQALRDSEQRFRNIFRTVPVGVVYADLDGNIRQPNEAYCALTGYSAAELMRMSIQSLVHPDDRPIDAQLTAELKAGVLPVYRRRTRYVTRDGRELWVASIITQQRDADGMARRLVGVVQDITGDIRLEEAERARESAEAANRAKSDFLSRMSHELRTPLNAMLGFAQLLELDEQHRLAARQGQWVAQIQSAGWHLLEMINDVLDLSRIESGSLRLQLARLDVQSLVDESVGLVSRQAQERGVRFVVSGVPAGRVIADATRLKQVLTNLLSNAVKYNREGGEVRVSFAGLDDTASREPMLAIKVCDTGMGMSEQQLRQLFQPFNRLGRERGPIEGTGIGLVICKLLMEHMGGRLEASSTEGVGSCFVIRLPLAPAGGTRPAELDELESAPARYHARTVHYIEDNETNVEVMRGMLIQRPQVDLTVSRNGLDGLADVRARRPDLVLLDMHLPDMDGIELLRHLRSDPSTAEIPVVVVSADALPAQIEAAFDAGATRYLTKPVSVNTVLSVVDELLDAQASRFG